MIEVIKDRDAIWDSEKYDAILIGTSTYCMLTNGFQSKIKVKYPKIEEVNIKTPYGDRRKLGKRLTITTEEGKPTLSLCFICNYPHKYRTFLDYAALERCIRTADAEFNGKNVMTTLIGCSQFDGNGDRDEVMKILERSVDKMNLYVYDYRQYPKREEVKLINAKLALQNKSKLNVNVDGVKEYLREKLYIDY